MKQKEIKQIFLHLGLVFVLQFFIGILFCEMSFRIYEQYVLNNYATTLNGIIKKYPDLEADIVKLMTTSAEDADPSILEQYGIQIQNLQNIQDIKDMKTKLQQYYFLFGLFIFLIITIIYSLHFFHFHRDLKKIIKSINNVLRNKPSLNLEEYQEGIISTLNNDVVKITDQLKNYNEVLQQDKKYLEETLSDISHQLKTPLTSMYVINDLLSSNSLDEKDKQQFLEKNQEQLERIEWLVTALLKLSRLESGTIQLKKETVKVQELLEDTIKSLEIPMELKNQTLTIKGNKHIILTCDTNWTKEAILNIIKNAHEHTKDGGRIDLTYEENPLYIMITIRDNGEGIEKKDLPHVFERFYKGSHNSKESIGIGLNMSKNIIERQNGVINVESKKGEYTLFTIKFYKA